MPAIIRSLINSIQTIDGVDIKPFALQTRQGSTAALVAAVAARTIQMTITPEDQGQNAANLSVYAYAPLTATAIQVPDDAEEVQVNPAGTIAALTVHLPVNPYPNQKVTLAFKAAVTALTLDAATATVAATVQGAMTAATAGGFGSYRYDQPTAVWVRIG